MKKDKYSCVKVDNKLSIEVVMLKKRPTFEYKSGATYEGEWRGEVREGFGIQTWPDGARYQGEWKQNKANGKGIFYHIDGDKFEGEWYDDKANGYGVYVHAKGG